MTTPPSPQERLGQLIFDENPYTREAAAEVARMAGSSAKTAPEVTEFLKDKDSPTTQQVLDAFHKAMQKQVELNAPEIEIERDYQTSEWYFKGQNLRVARAIRIPYCFRDAFGKMVEEYILVGFEGSGEYG